MHVSSLIFVTRACSKEHSPDPIHHPHLSVTFHSAFQVRMSHGIPDSVQSRWKHLWGQSRPSSYSSSLHIVAALICAMPGRASCQPMTRRRCAGLNLSFETTLSSGRHIPGAGGIDTCSRVSRSHICTHLCVDGWASGWCVKSYSSSPSSTRCRTYREEEAQRASTEVDRATPQPHSILRMVHHGHCPTSTGQGPRICLAIGRHSLQRKSHS
jgi:hypothetical protein